MSSSKIIKQGDRDGGVVEEFSFKSIVAPVVAPPEVQKPGGFVPSTLHIPSGFVAMELGQQNAEGEAAVEVGPPTIEITEDELNQRTRDSFDAGLKEGKDLAERGLINVFRALRASSETIHDLRDKIFRESEDELIDLVMLVARKVIIQEIAQDRSILAAVIQNALANLSAREEITVSINPVDYQMVTSGHDEILQQELLNDRLLLKPDPSIAIGTCRVDTEMGIIDASLDSQLEQIYQSILEQRTAAVAVAAEENIAQV